MILISKEVFEAVQVEKGRRSNVVKDKKVVGERTKNTVQKEVI